MRAIIVVVLIVLAGLLGCATKTICANGTESYRPVLDPGNSCKIRVRQVMVGTDVKLPTTLAIDGDAINWTYDWVGSEFKNGQIELGHVILKSEPAAPELEKK
jgi:hypothetical protein